MAAEWSALVNSDFYGADSGYKDNTEEVEFKSGRSIAYLKNSVPKKTHAVSLKCNDTGTQRVDGKTEFEHFLDWFENTVKSGAVPFYLADIVTHSGRRLYRIKVTGWTGQRSKEVDIELEEV